MNDAADVTTPEGIAIIGMSGRLPGAANLEQFWRNLVEGVDSISRFSAGELEHSVATPEAEAKGQTFVRARGILEDADRFDAAFFGIYPREAELMDPQHRVFLECAWEAIESAGHDPERYPGMIGVFAGLSLNTYLIYNLCSHPGFGSSLAGNFQVGEYHTLVGNDKDFMPTRVSYRLNLRGPSMTVQCGCSTSLVAVAQACTSLQTYQCDMALAGGVSISFPQKRDYRYTPDGMVSPDGTCRTFDAEAKGTVFSHGAGVVLLKRLADAIADGDPILAVIKGFAVNNDGSDKVGYAAPSVKGQAEVIAMAQAAAGIHPETITYVEAHGTGTPLGDPIEVTALTQAFRQAGATRNGYCAIGSGKTHIGHLDAAAGVTGLIKTVLQLQHELIPPLLHFRSPNPRIDFANSPFYPVTRPIAWKRGETPRRAGVSALGVGGTNAHVVVEESPELPASDPGRSRQLILLSARSESALHQMAENLAAHCEAHPDQNLADIAYTLQVGRRGFPFRLALVANSADAAAAALRSGKTKAVATGRVAAQPASVAFLFPGQGSQYSNMGRELYGAEAVFRAEVDRCANILQAHLGRDIRKVLFPDVTTPSGETDAINETALAQPAIFTIEYALARLWMSWGIKPAVLLGHSIGEYVCAVLAEVFTLEHALALLSTRARLMQALPGGSMMAVRMPAAELETQLPPGVAIAALNSPKLCTVSGPTETLRSWQLELEKRKIATLPLRTSHAFHSAMMDPMLPEFIAAAERTPRSAPKLPWISTCTGRTLSAEDAQDAGYWARQLRQPVRLVDAMQTLWQTSSRVLLEVGPGQALCQLARQQDSKPADLVVVSSLPSAAEVDQELAAALNALGRLWIAGVQPDWQAFHAGATRRRVSLPTYPFERKRYFVEPARTPASLPASPNPNPAPSEMRQSETRQPNPSPAQPARARRDEIAAQLLAMIRELSGVATEEFGASATFMEMGFDSLFLSELSRAVELKYGQPLTFRQLTGELGTPLAVAAHLDANLPQAWRGASPPPSIDHEGPASVAPQAAETANVAELRAIRQQLELITRQLERVTEALLARNSRNGDVLSLSGAERDTWLDSRTSREP